MRIQSISPRTGVYPRGGGCRGQTSLARSYSFCFHHYGWGFFIWRGFLFYLTRHSRPARESVYFSFSLSWIYPLFCPSSDNRLYWVLTNCQLYVQTSPFVRHKLPFPPGTYVQNHPHVPCHLYPSRLSCHHHIVPSYGSNDAS